MKSDYHNCAFSSSHAAKKSKNLVCVNTQQLSMQTCTKNYVLQIAKSYANVIDECESVE